MERPHVECPICGARMLVACIYTHAAGTRCLMTFHLERAGVHHDAIAGPKVLKLAKQIHRLLRVG